MEDYVHKVSSKSEFDDVFWNIPEQKYGVINVIGGNSQSFRSEVRTAEFLAKSYPLQEARLILPDNLKGKMPELDNVRFLRSAESGSFVDAAELAEAMDAADFSLVLGDLTKNNLTGKAIAGACKIAEKPLLFTRDAVDLLAENGAMDALMRDNTIIVGSMVQVQKLLKAVYYPKMILLSQSITKVAETIHKFTLSYPVRLVTLFNDTVIVAAEGKVNLIPLKDTKYSPLTLWGGELAGKIAALTIYNNAGDFLRVAGGSAL